MKPSTIPKLVTLSNQLFYTVNNLLFIIFFLPHIFFSIHPNYLVYIGSHNPTSTFFKNCHHYLCFHPFDRISFGHYDIHDHLVSTVSPATKKQRNVIPFSIALNGPGKQCLLHSVDRKKNTVMDPRRRSNTSFISCILGISFSSERWKVLIFGHIGHDSSRNPHSFSNRLSNNLMSFLGIGLSPMASMIPLIQKLAQ